MKELKIKSIEKIEHSSMNYDIEVEDNNNFFANNILVHNSSISIGIIPKYPNGFIASRNLIKSFKVKKHVGRRNKTLLENLMFWTKPDLNLYKEVDNDDDFIKYGKPYLEELKKLETNVILRGELNGGKMKGSGNKNNPASKEETNIKFFGIDYFDSEKKRAIRVEQDMLGNILIQYNLIQNNVKFEMPKIVFNDTFFNKEELEKTCNDYFKENMIEGIVIRSTEDAKFSCKFMNPEYDSKK